MNYHIPTQFRFQDKSRYPIDNVEDFEWWLSNHATNPPGDRIYLPITWTAYYKTCKYGDDPVGLHKLQIFLDSLNRKKKYWTVCQWDDGIINDVSMLDLRQYNMGAAGDYQLPLICQPHAYRPGPRIKKDIFCSFVGRITHPIRDQLVKAYNKLPSPTSYCSTSPHGLTHFCEVLARSKYVYAPRGYGKTSFRICEALQYGCHVIYHSDVHLKPHQLETPVIKYINNCDSVFMTEQDLNPDPSEAIELHSSHFTYAANKELIFKDLINQ